MQLFEVPQDSNEPLTLVERRAQLRRTPDNASPLFMTTLYAEQARAQLRDARLRLIAARRRVGELDEAVRNWDRFTNDLRDR